jgi:hypothetical protein
VKRLLAAAFGQVDPAPPDPGIPQADDLAKAVVFEQAYAKRFDACTLLAQAYGERATVCLLPYLRHEDPAVITNAYLGILRVGRDGVLPLSVAVRADGDMRRLVAQLLGQLDDPRALAVLLELGEKDGANSPAAKAAAKLRLKHPDWAGNGTAASAHLVLARRCFEWDVSPLPRDPLVWTLTGDQLTSRLSDRHLYRIEIGKRAAEDAVRLDPKDAAAQAMLGDFRRSEEIARKLVVDLR